MRHYVITGIATAVIICVVSGLWLGWGINLVDFTTALAVGLILIIPVIWWWAYNKERDTRHGSISTDRSYWQLLKKLKPKKCASRHPTFTGIETDPDRMDPELRRRREDDWRYFPSNVR